MNERGVRQPSTARTILSAAVILLVLVGLAISLRPRLFPAKKPVPVVTPVEVTSPTGGTPRGIDSPNSPFLNTRPEVKYVADTRCDDCHAEIAARYRQHPMGRSISVLDAAAIEAEAKIAPAPAESLQLGGFEYEVDYSGGKAVHRESYLDANGESALTISKELAYEVGAGSRGRSYLVRQGDHLLMSPLTWYPAHDKWALSPGYERNHSHFYRPVIGACLFCHAGEAKWDENTRNRYEEPILPQPAITCQRCHGPGELHVAKHSSALPLTSGEGRGEGIEITNDFDPTIVNPAHLPDPLALDVCAQCHLSGAARVIAPGQHWNDFRPGLPLSDFIAIYVERQSAGHHFVGHAEQMQESRCFVGSEGKLRCTSCHDPHGVPAKDEQVEFYRQRCLECHGEGKNSCAEIQEVRQAKQDNCVACHMPALSTEIAHAAVTDHRVPRRPNAEEVATEPANVNVARRLIPFDRNVLTRPGYPVQRNLGLAMLIASENSGTMELTEYTQAAVPLLEMAVEQDAVDFAAREGLATAYERLRRPAEALAQFEIVLQDHPQREFSLAGSARQLLLLNRFSDAAGAFQEVRTVNPHMPLYYAEGGLALARQHEWDECEKLCRDALEKFRDSFACRQLLVESLLGLERTEDAERAFAELVRLQPASAGALRKWYAQHPLKMKSNFD